jgi:hypothetical protein
MSHRIRFGRYSRVAALAVLAAAPGLLAETAAATAPASVAQVPPTIDPDATDRELICRMLKLLGKPCPSQDFLSYEDYYGLVDEAWTTCDHDGFDPQRRVELLAAALDVRDSQTPAPAGVDPAAYQSFMLVLDEIIYEMGG